MVDIVRVVGWPIVSKVLNGTSRFYQIQRLQLLLSFRSLAEMGQRGNHYSMGNPMDPFAGRLACMGHRKCILLSSEISVGKPTLVHPTLRIKGAEPDTLGYIENSFFHIMQK